MAFTAVSPGILFCKVLLIQNSIMWAFVVLVLIGKIICLLISGGCMLRRKVCSDEKVLGVVLNVQYEIPNTITNSG